MKEILTEWRKFVNEYEDVYDREQSLRNAIAKPDTTLDNLMNAVLKRVFTMYAFLYPDEAKDLKGFAPTKYSPGDGEMYVRPPLRKYLTTLLSGLRTTKSKKKTRTKQRH